MEKTLRFIEKFIPKRLYRMGQPLYHFTLSFLATLIYGFPSKNMVVIGVTGTKGKTSTANFIWSTLTAGGYTTGIVTTANIRIGGEESMNYLHMTMPGRFAIQRLMKKMVAAGCTHCVIETPSQGLTQFRHVGVYYDMGVFTNLTPEHISAHGNFENYKNAKKKMFRALSNHTKTINGKKVEKLILVNADSEHAPDFLAFDADIKITYSIKNASDYRATNIVPSPYGSAFKIENKLQSTSFELSIPGVFNIYNSLPAIAISQHLGVSDELIAKGLSDLRLIPGRMERMDEGQDFTVFVDYAHEKQSMTNVIQAAQSMRTGDAKVIVLLGAEGGGRDKQKRSDMGEVVGAMADYVICSTTDPYDDDPADIDEDIAVVAEKFGKIRNQNLFIVVERRAGIAKCLSLAKSGDIVIITGKGAEQTMMVRNMQALPWDDRKVVREELRKVLGK